MSIHRFANWFPPPDPDQDRLIYWRQRILFGLLAGGLALCPIALIPSVILIMRYRLWGLAAINTVAIAGMVGLFFGPRLSFRIRSWGVIIVIYTIGLGILTHVGIFSGGPIWLFIAPIIASLLLGLRTGVLTILINACVLATIGFFISREMIGDGLQFFSNTESAFAALGNYVLLNAGATIVVSMMIRGLESVIRMHKETADRLRHEVSERQRGADALRESERQYRQIFENVQDVYYESSLDGRILQVSPSISKISHYTREELIGESLYEIYADPAQRDAFVRLVSEKRRVEEYEVLLKDKDGSLRTCSLVSSIVADSQGRPLSIVGSLRDITARKKAEAEQERLEAANIQLQKGESLGRMAGAVAHHFNNHLSVVMGNLELAIADAPEGSDQREFLDEAMQGTRRAADISLMMLTYLGYKVDTLEPLDLSEICRQCLSLIQAALPDRVRLEMDLAAPGPLVLVNLNQMQQVLMNLVTNALDAIGEGNGKLILATRSVPAAQIPMASIAPMDWSPAAPVLACLEFTDSGRGVAAEDLDKLFDPFFTTKFIGRGLGLPVALGIVKAWGGMIGVQSQIGCGTTFRIVLPLAGENDGAR